MNAKELAAKLNGIEYPVSIPKALVRAAKEASLVIVYGASDDLMEFEGAIYDEIGAHEGAEAYVDQKGLLPSWDDLDRYDKDAMRDYFKREASGKLIEALWSQDGYSWIYKTETPHEVFDVIEDGEKYCRGIVFSLADCGAAP